MSRKPKSRLKTLQDSAPEMLSTLRATRDILHNALNDNYFDRDVFTRLQERVLDVLRLALPDYTYVPRMKDKGQKDTDVNAKIKFTPGKWTVRKLFVEWGVFAERDGFRDREPVADCLDSEANARLIAEAPDMYELLKDLARTEKPTAYTPRFLEMKDKAREILARIEGANHE